MCVKVNLLYALLSEILKDYDNKYDDLIQKLQVLSNYIYCKDNLILSFTGTEDGYTFNPEQTKLVLQILVTSICDVVVEIVFENLLEWQVKDNQWDITDTSVIFNEQNWIIWLDDFFADMETTKKGTYVIAKSMKWRIIE